MGFPYTDVGVHYPCGPLGGELIDAEAGLLKLSVIGSAIGVKTGDGSPAGNGDSRGPVDRNSGPGGYFRRSLAFGTTFDVRGATSNAMIAWIRLNETDAGPHAFSCWNTIVTSQLWILFGRDTEDNDCPMFKMYDGVTVNNALKIKASPSAVMSSTDFHMIGGGYDNARNKIMCFWGDGSDSTGLTTHYAEADGFAAGYGAGILEQDLINVGRFAQDADPAFDIDHLSHWKYAFNEQDFLNHWQLGTGLLRSEFANDPGRGDGASAASVVGAINYYYGRP